MQSKPSPPVCFIKMGIKIKHPGIVNRARYMPQNPAVLATKSSNGTVYIYNVRKMFLAAKNKEKYNPELKLKALTAGGSGMSWNPNRKGYIVSSSTNERTIRLWDINSKPIKDGSSLNKFIRGHPSGVKDCAWHCLHSSLFGSTGKGKHIHIWDIRADFTKMPAITGIGHTSSVNCISFNYFSDHLLATGSSDQTIAIWDLRKMKSPSHQIYWHKAETCQLHWSPNNESILASSGVDARLLLWDISSIGAHQTLEGSKEGPPELLFIHGGHSDSILDFSWNLTEPWLLSSVSQDNVIQLWQMDSHIYDNNRAKKLSRMKSSKLKESLKGLAMPGSSKSLSKPVSQAYLESPSFEFPESSSRIEPPNIMESPDIPISSKSVSLPVRTSPKSQQPILTTCKSVEAFDYLAIPGPSKAPDLTSEFLLSSESPFYPPSPLLDEFLKHDDMLLKPLPCLSPLSESLFEDSPKFVASPELPILPASIGWPKPSSSPMFIEDSPKTVASTELPKLPTSMESSKSVEMPPTPESIRLSELSPSGSPSPPESAKAILFSFSNKSKKYSESTKNTENINNQDKQEEEEALTQSDFSKFSSLDWQSYIPTPYEFSTFFTDTTTEQMPVTSRSTWYNCQGNDDSEKCRICFHLKTLNEADQSWSKDYQSPPMCFSPLSDFSQEDSSSVDCLTFSNTPNPLDISQSPDMKIQSSTMYFSSPHMFSSESPANEEYATFSEIQDPSGSSQSADAKSSDSLIQLIEDCIGTPYFQTPADVILTSDHEEPPNNPLNPDDTAYQDFQMLPESEVPVNILDPSDSHITSDMITPKDITDYLEETIFSNFQTPAVSPPFQNNNTIQNVPVYPEGTPNIQKSQDDPVSTITNISNSNILVFPDFQDIIESSP
ncbi:unnamed protein product [Nezara viridula]|uniref:Uncharacterized protein n=1 Tax=Nezara viridula TaxID=85310 RepID=A0A9P0E8E4_NEZVI|nr:unnamed protein product [Nezara viridula]